MDSQTSRVLNAWCHWLGLPDQWGSAEGVRYFARFEKTFDRISQFLFSPPSENENRTGQIPVRPEADFLLAQVSRKVGIVPKAFWPNDSPYAICITHDIDRILSTIHRSKGLLKEPWQALKNFAGDGITALIPQLRDRNPFFNFREIAALEKHWNVPSAAYVLFEKRRLAHALRKGEPQHFIGVYSPKTIFQDLVEYENAGNEVGIHNSFDSWNDSNVLNRELAALRDGGIKQIHGGRCHYLNFDARITPKIAHEGGLRYDSTMGFNLRNGFRAGTCFPFKMGSLWEIPFQLMDSALRYQFKDMTSRQVFSQSILREVKGQGGLLVVNWHSHVMNPKFFPEEVDSLFSLVAQGKRDGAYFARPSDFIDWWECRGAEVV